MSIVDTINSVHDRLTRNKRWSTALIVLVALSYLTLIISLIGLLSPLLGWIVGLLGGSYAIFQGWKTGFFSSPTIEEASSFIDQKFATKDRALTLAATWGETGEAEKGILERQLEELVPQFDHNADIPLTLSPRLRRCLYSLPLVWGILLTQIFSGGGETPAHSQAERIADLLAERGDIPLGVRESLIELKDTLETKPLTDEAVIEALKAAQAELAAAQEEAAQDPAEPTDDTVDESEVGEGSSDGDLSSDSPRDIAPVGKEPTPTPEPTVTPTAVPSEQKTAPAEEPRDPTNEPPPDESAKEEKKEQQQSSPDDTDVQNSQSSKEQGKSEQRSDSEKNDGGEGEEKSNQQQSGGDSSQSDSQASQDKSQQGQDGDGDGDGNSSSKEGQQPGKSGGKSGSQGQSGQHGSGGKSGDGKESSTGQKEGSAGARSSGQAGAPKDSGLEEAQQALDKIEQELKAEQQGDQKGDQEGDKEGADKGDKGDSNSGKPSGSGGDKQGKGEKRAEPGKGQGSGKKPGEDQNSKDRPPSDAPGKSGGKGGQQGSPNEQSSNPGGEPGDNEPREEFGEPPKLPTGSSLPKESDAAMGPGDENGGLGAGLGDRKGFKDTEIKTGAEKYDSRFTGADGKVGLNKGPARAKTRIEDVKLAKPDPIKDPSEQPIPLEYRDILE